jgi:hypothetical protein
VANEEFRQVLAGLVGYRVVAVRRSVDILVFEFVPPEPAPGEPAPPAGYRFTFECPVRLRRGGEILLGSADINQPEDGDADWREAFDGFATVYDAKARELQARWAEEPCLVERAGLRTGDLTVELSGELVLEAFPVSSTLDDCWRVIGPKPLHIVYPEDFREV